MTKYEPVIIHSIRHVIPCSQGGAEFSLIEYNAQALPIVSSNHMQRTCSYHPHGHRAHGEYQCHKALIRSKCDGQKVNLQLI